MLPLIPTPWKVAALVAALALVGGAVWQIREGLKEQGRREERSIVDRSNQEASDAARKAREAHDLACARNEPGCLRDPWTRDGGR